jgi:hypothetical protein
MTVSASRVQFASPSPSTELDDQPVASLSASLKSIAYPGFFHARDEPLCPRRHMREISRVDKIVFLFTAPSCGSLCGPRKCIASVRTVRIQARNSAHMDAIPQDVFGDVCEKPAPIGVLSAIKCVALVACFQSGGTLYKRFGIWSESPTEMAHQRISGNTVADLSREGLLTISTIGKHAIARLTPRGEWFARTAATKLKKPSAMFRLSPGAT